MIDPPITRKDLPYLEVQSIEEGPLTAATEELPAYPTWLIRGRVSRRSIVDKENWCTLLGVDRNCLHGNWLAQPSADGDVVFDTANQPGRITVGTRLPCAGNYGGWAAILIEDGSAAWEKRVFKPQNAIATWFTGTDGQRYRSLREMKDGQVIDGDAKVVVDGWDHEHCMICNNHIEPEDLFFKHISENEFLCVECYERHAMIGDISFLIPAQRSTDSHYEE